MIEYFMMIYENHMSNNRLPIHFQKVHLDWIDPDVFEAILRYIYTGQVFHITSKTYIAKISIQITFIKIRSKGFILIQILESHQKYDENIDLLSGVFLAADMFQMIDLEAAVLQRLSKCCTPNNCLSLYLLVQNLESLAAFASLEVSHAKEEVCM